MQKTGVTNVAVHAGYTNQSEILATSGDGGIHIWNYSISGKNPCLIYSLPHPCFEQDNKQKGYALLEQSSGTPLRHRILEGMQ